jgi:hypothetical protein
VTNYKTFPNITLGLQINGYTLHWLGKRGMRWKEVIPTFDEYLLTRPQPQILLIQLRSNDLAILKSKELIELIRLDVLHLQALFPELILMLVRFRVFSSNT